MKWLIERATEDLKYKKETKISRTIKMSGERERERERVKSGT